MGRKETCSLPCAPWGVQLCLIKSGPVSVQWPQVLLQAVAEGRAVSKEAREEHQELLPCCLQLCMFQRLGNLADAAVLPVQEVLLGTHNQGSVEGAVAEMARLGLEPRSSPVYFGQLLGMSDHLTQVCEMRT